jgi:hypothetical protein
MSGTVLYDYDITPINGRLRASNVAKGKAATYAFTVTYTDNVSWRPAGFPSATSPTAAGFMP